MKRTLIGALCLAQLTAAAAPAVGAELHPDRSTGAAQMSAFAGARLRVPLGGGREKAHAGIALTSTLRSSETGQLRFAKGAEFGFSGTDSKLDLSIAGRPVSQLAPRGSAPDGQRQGFSTVGWVIIGASVAIIVGGVLIFDYISDQSE